MRLDRYIRDVMRTHDQRRCAVTTAGQFALACATVAGAALVLWVGMEACGRILDYLSDRQGRAVGPPAPRACVCPLPRETGGVTLPCEARKAWCDE